MNAEKNKQKFLEKAKVKFGDKFDYSKVDYIRADIPVTIVCPIHGEFEKTPTSFLVSKHGCNKCANQSNSDAKRITQEEFITRSKQLYSDKFTYEKTQYINSETKLIVTCRIHGDFLTKPSDFLKGHSCPKCKGEQTAKFNRETKRQTQEEFIKKCKLLYGNLFSYDKVIYINSRTKVLIHSNLCNEDFYEVPANFLQGRAKKKYLGLNYIKQNLSKEAFIQRSKLIHGEDYDYSKCNYVDTKTKVEIICPKHGSFWQTPGNHIWNRQGCPVCNQSRGENMIANILDNLKINYKRQYVVNTNNRKYEIDFCFFLKDKIIFIEYNGQQHYQPIEFFGGEERFKEQVQRDEEVRQYCKNNNIILLEYKYDILFEDLQTLVRDNIKNILENCEENKQNDKIKESD